MSYIKLKRKSSSIQWCQNIKDLITKVAPSDARVMITGANGTGKELVARALHDNSNRSKNQFIEVT